jgi:hypothetical protein
MGIAAAESARLSWLTARFSEQRSKAVALLSRMRNMLTDSALVAMSPLKFSRFMGMLKEVADAQDDEKRILSRIEDVEQQHRMARHNNRVKRAALDQADTSDLDLEPCADRPKNNLLLWLVIWYAYFRNGIFSPKQELRPD